eukprot:scaffold33789_cov66-Phaeocystis_antarctica.AAC.1
MHEPGCNWNRRSGPSSVCASPSSSSQRLMKPESLEASSLHRTVAVPHAAWMRVSLPLDCRTRERPILSAVWSSVNSSPQREAAASSARKFMSKTDILPEGNRTGGKRRTPR